MINQKIKDLITPETIKSYAKACLDIGLLLPELFDNGYQTIVIPSRGAYPFYDGANSANWLWNSFSKKSYYDYHSKHRIWLLPFTSDFGDTSLKIESSNIRRFWSRVLSDFIKGNESIYTRYYETLVEELGLKLTINTSELLLKKELSNHKKTDQRFIFIDTVISGRAICEIIQAFKDCNLTNYYIIAVIDENGDKLKEEYKKIINEESAHGRLKSFYVDKIFSEDASPLLNSGITSIVFPSLMEQTFFEIKEFRENNIVGAGLWFIDSISHLKYKNPTLNGVRGTLSVLIFSSIQQQLYSEEIFFDEFVRHSVDEMISDLGSINLFSGESTVDLIYNRIRRGTQITEKVTATSSHVVRIDLHQNDINSIVERYRKTNSL